MQQENLDVNGTNYQLRIFYEKRNSVRASIGKNGVIIRIPIHLNREEQFKEVMKMKAWAIKKLQEKPIKKEIQKEYKDGDVINVGNRMFNLSIAYRDKDSSSGRIEGDIIKLAISQNLSKNEQNNHVSSLISRCIGRIFLPYVKEKIHNLNKLYFNQQINKIFLRNTSSKWGSCSENNNISISTRLLFAPDDVLTYVCIHELAHLVEHNHSPQFWKLVEKAMPNYKENIKWLKENGYECRF